MFPVNVVLNEFGDNIRCGLCRTSYRFSPTCLLIIILYVSTQVRNIRGARMDGFMYI